MVTMCEFMPYNMGNSKVMLAGTEVEVFYRTSRDPDEYFMTQDHASGMIHPVIGITDGWTPAVVTEDFDPAHFNTMKPETYIRVRYTYQHWYNHRGQNLQSEAARGSVAKVHPRVCREVADGKGYQPDITFVIFRWGGEKPVDPVTEGEGGWGHIGATPSNNYINGFFEHALRTLGPTYEVISIFFQNSSELEHGRLSGCMLRELARGQHIGAMYFCWPIGFEDGHDYPGYVERTRLLKLMQKMEASGIPTRFPHNSIQYTLFASKEWTAQQCLTPGLNVPLTTKVSRQMIEYNGPDAAAREALDSLRSLQKARNTLFDGFDDPVMDDSKISIGVAKLGWSWEAVDVVKWTNFHQLRTALDNLMNQPNNKLDFCFVQEFIDFDVEMRHYVLMPTGVGPPPIRKVVYTQFQRCSGGRFCEFSRFNRSECLTRAFSNDDIALADAEEKAKALIARWLKWLRADCAELPVCIRFDIMAKRVGPGQARVTTGELTELGGCFLGWPEGPKEVFSAMIHSFYGFELGAHSPKKRSIDAVEDLES